MAEPAICRHPPKVGAVCPNRARTDLCGGRPAMDVPTAILRVDPGDESGVPLWRAQPPRLHCGGAACRCGAARLGRFRPGPRLQHRLLLPGPWVAGAAPPARSLALGAKPLVRVQTATLDDRHWDADLAKQVQRLRDLMQALDEAPATAPVPEPPLARALREIAARVNERLDERASPTALAAPECGAASVDAFCGVVARDICG
jgi:hypothetical protein